MTYNFEWDMGKASSNLRKHRVSFNEATTVFRDPRAISIYDNAHNESEDRWMTLGISDRGKILVVCHTFVQLNNDTVCIRIFTSRKANQQEQKHYNG